MPYQFRVLDPDMPGFGGRDRQFGFGLDLVEVDNQLLHFQILAQQRFVADDESLYVGVDLSLGQQCLDLALVGFIFRP